MKNLPPFISRTKCHNRLQQLFPEGTQHRNYCTREIAASTVFAMIYIGAVEGRESYLAPKHVYRMSDEQSALTSVACRIDYATSVMAPGTISLGQPWYADTTREPIRDETLRQGLIAIGAAFERNLPTTSPKGRYRLKNDFAKLFDPELRGNELAEALNGWRSKHMTPAALARIELIRSGASPHPDDYLVTFPNGETQRLSPGESSVITKAVIEHFVPTFLEEPHIVWVSESGNKVVARHDIQAKKLGLDLDVNRLLPDIIVVDLAPMSIVFVEVVSTDGPITTQRREELLQLAHKGGHAECAVVFVTAFMSRGRALRKALSDLAWNSFVWIASEPDCLIALEGADRRESRGLHDRLKNLGKQQQ